jgi:carboxylesterase
MLTIKLKVPSRGIHTLQIKAPEPFLFEAGERAVLLLHGFTGNTADVRMLGRFLESKGYTTHAPQYKGHGNATPENFIKTTHEDWWESVINGYNVLKNKGYKRIAAAGLSLGGVFSLKLAMTYPLVGIAPMCAPLGFSQEDTLKNMVLSYAKEYKKSEGKSEKEIENEIKVFQNQPMNSIKGLKTLVENVRNRLHEINVPTLVIQGKHDQIIDMDSPTIIYDQIQSEVKEIQWYEQSGHVITLGKERNLVEEDIVNFLEKLDWDGNVEMELTETQAPQIWW